MSSLLRYVLGIGLLTLSVGVRPAFAEPDPGAQEEDATSVAPDVEAGVTEDLSGDELEEVNVFGERALRQARERVIRAFEAEGWRAKAGKGGDTTLKPPSAWMGRAHLSREGELWFNTPSVAFNGVRAMAPAAVDEPQMQVLSRDAAGQSIGAGGNFALPSATKQAAAHKRVLDAIGPELGKYHRMIAANAMKRTLDDLPGRLDAVWTQGRPLEGEALIEGAPARRAEILGFWGTRADTPEGMLISKAVEAWVTNTLADDADGPTEAELEVAEALRADRRSFPRAEAPLPNQEE